MNAVIMKTHDVANYKFSFHNNPVNAHTNLISIFLM